MKNYSQNIGVNDGTANPVINQIRVNRYGQFPNAQEKLGGISRTNKLIRNQQANEKVYSDNDKALGIYNLEKMNAQRSEEKKARRARFKAERKQV